MLSAAVVIGALRVKIITEIILKMEQFNFTMQ